MDWGAGDPQSKGRVLGCRNGVGKVGVSQDLMEEPLLCTSTETAVCRNQQRFIIRTKLLNI